MKAISLARFGSPDVMEYAEIDRPQPGPGEVVVRNRAIGVNFIDVYQRTGRYPGALPLTLGIEGAGEIVERGPAAEAYPLHARVAYVGVPGSYAEYTVVPESRLIPLPDGISEQAAAAVLEQGMTAHYLSHDTYPIQAGDTVLVHAAAGGVGLLLTQLARRRGARVIATVSTAAKAELACQAGADKVILYSQVDFEAEVQRLTDGAGVHAVYDSVGLTTFEKGLNLLRPRGAMVLFGASSGPAPQLDPQRLMRGSLYLTRPSLPHYIADQAALLGRANDVLGWVKDGSLKLHIGRTYALAQAAQAHSDLESRATTGKLLLLPNA
ncbi:MAG TPA: quinone oxidoreductase [Herpetosiphonaceae bacterium]|nr:quinone oxidoreductase [Herpetosiphonaceae bacterium]